MVHLSGLYLLLVSLVAAQNIQPSNDTSDLTDPASSPRFFINATGAVQFPGFQVAPLGEYAYISRNVFMQITFSGIIINTDASNANQANSNDFNFVSCDPEDYEGGNIDVSGMARIITSQQSNGSRDKSSLIFYSRRSNHCNASDINSLPSINGIFTTIDPVVAGQIADRNFSTTSNAVGTLTPDRSAYSGSGGGGNNSLSRPPTTAIAMIILYSITGIITSLFIIIIITGAIRAHRHPERYGPRNGPGRPRQSRAKGIARAMLETLPIVKFGDHENLPKNQDTTKQDIEAANKKSLETSETPKPDEKTVTMTTANPANASADSVLSQSAESGDAISKAASGDQSAALGCSICTEDFQKGEELRVLPCNHKFHPDCVDPWLLNVSGTCPLCRINLAPEADESENATQDADGNVAPPLASGAAGDRRSQAIHTLMAMASGSREERIAALRRYRAERRNRNSTIGLNDEERISRARRFREALRIRTRTHDPHAHEMNEVELQMRNTGVDALSGSHPRL